MAETGMIERVARAIYDVNTPSKHCVPFEGLHPLSQKKLRLRARAAIEAMRTPTEAMLRNPGHDAAMWQAMIDSLLKEEGQ